MGKPTILDIANRNASDSLTGIIEEAIKATPEMQIGYAKTIKGIMYKTLVRTALPSVSFRDANEGTVAVKSITELRTVETYILNPRFMVDKAVADMDERGWEAYLADEAIAMTAGGLQTVCSQLYYGLTNDAKGFPGLLAAIDSTNMEVDAAGDGTDCSSVWGVKWGEQDVSWVFGDNGNMDLSDVRISDIVTNTETEASLTKYVQEIMARIGLQVGNTKAIGRIRDVDAGKPLTDDLLAQLLAKFPVGKKPDMFLMSRRSQSQLQQSRTATNPTGAPAPFPESAFNIPIIVTDSIKDTETAV